MFRKQRRRQNATDEYHLNASEIVSQVGEVYANFNEQRRLVKPRSSLPCPWFVARECFMIAYEAEYLLLPDKIRDSYHHVYRELAFFIDDGLCNEFEASLNVAVKCRSERLRKAGFPEDEALSRKLLASLVMVVSKDRKAIWEDLAKEESCPRHDLLVLAETLSYCSGLYRALWDEWAAFANLIAYRKSTSQGGC
ncbi:MAG: hypothetical protein NTW07_00575 [candidate division Zixibacteria bacterium]|nr:hypothetical protein [candidate division Zixibacteria bacterium]